MTEEAVEGSSVTGTIGTPLDFKNRRIALGTPSPDLIDQGFHHALIELISSSAKFVALSLTNVVSSRIAVNRNTIVQQARILGATDILWIDADSKFPINGLMRLLLHDKDIACATTSRRKGTDRSPIAVPFDFASIQPSQQLVKMKHVGFPFMLTKMSVFDKMDADGISPDKVYFAEPPRWMMRKNGWEAPGADGLVGEDEYFCLLAMQAGFEIWCDMELTMEIGHIGTHVYYVENAEVPAARVDEAL